ncbi:nicotinate phosphoribosyltransferase [soil metagenome]
MNLLLMTDSYKAGHARLYPPDLTSLYCYVESRGGKFPATVFFGLQYYILKYLSHCVTLDDVDEAEAFWTAHFGRNDVFDGGSWRRLVRTHGGNLPLQIKAVPEGTLVPTGNVLMTIESTDPDFAWLPTFVETLLLKLWYPTTIATQSFSIRQRIQHWYQQTGTPMESLEFACHDFGYRGVSSEETAGLGAAAHLLSFNGTDTVAGIRLLADYYRGGMSGFSIPATEHSIITSFRTEAMAYGHLLDTFPSGFVACVSDSHDIYSATEHLWGEEFHDRIMGRDGRLVVRPDSGDPNVVVPEVLKILGSKFPVRRNEAGFVTLTDQVRVIQGDGMDHDSINELYAAIVAEGWTADNLVVGSGGGLLQHVNRDTCRIVLKASQASYADGTVRSIQKTPITDSGKHSKPGRLKLVEHGDGGFSTVSDVLDPDFHLLEDALQTVYFNGAISPMQSLDEVRARVRAS